MTQLLNWRRHIFQILNFFSLKFHASLLRNFAIVGANSEPVREMCLRRDRLNWGYNFPLKLRTFSEYVALHVVHYIADYMWKLLCICTRVFSMTKKVTLRSPLSSINNLIRGSVHPKSTREIDFVAQCHGFFVKFHLTLSLYASCRIPPKFRTDSLPNRGPFEPRAKTQHF